MSRNRCLITNNKGHNAVLISEGDWKAIQETLYLNSIPGMTKSILKAAGEPRKAAGSMTETRSGNVQNTFQQPGGEG